jgi:hypothetical protein
LIDLSEVDPARYVNENKRIKQRLTGTRIDAMRALLFSGANVS